MKVQVIVSKVLRAKGTKAYRFNSVEENSLFITRNNLSNRVIDVLENYSSIN